MLKKYLSLICTVILLISVCGCSEKSGEQTQKLVIGCDNCRPYCYINEDGEFAGIDVEIAREACRRVGYQPVFKQIQWKSRENSLKNRSVDCLWSCLSMDEEDKSFSWVGPYMYSHQVVVVLKNSLINSFEDLKQQEIAVKVASKTEKIFQDNSVDYIKGIQNIYCMDDMETVVAALRNNYVDACAGDSAALVENLNTAGVIYRILDKDLDKSRLGVAFSNSSQSEVRDNIEKALAEMRLDGTIKRILTNYGLDSSKALIGGNHR